MHTHTGMPADTVRMARLHRAVDIPPPYVTPVSEASLSDAMEDSRACEVPREVNDTEVVLHAHRGQPFRMLSVV